MELVETELCELAFKYGTDKCPKLGHYYTPFYYEYFKDKRKSFKKVLEIGIGPYKGRSKRKHPFVGASLYMWRDFFPNAQIYGADIRSDTIFEDKRIKTFLCDQRIEEDLVKLITNTGSDIDIFIDDGSHELADQILTCTVLLPLFRKDFTYIIEDVVWSKKLMSALGEYECWVPQITNRGGNNQLVVVKHKK